MSDLEPLLRYWRAQDDAFERVVPYGWGAVVSDARFPRVQEANYARVEARSPLGLGEIDAALLPENVRAAAARAHVVVFFPEDQTDLLSEASSRGERLSWDLVMEHVGRPPARDPRVEEVASFDDVVAAAHRESMRWFDIVEPDVVDELVEMERTIWLPLGRRWFAIREGGRPVALAGLLVLDGVALVDHVVTFPRARRRGYATALAGAAVAAATEAGARRTYLLAEPGGSASRIYAGLGFRPVTQIASWLSPRLPA